MGEVARYVTSQLRDSSISPPVPLFSLERANRSSAPSNQVPCPHLGAPCHATRPLSLIFSPWPRGCFSFPIQKMRTTNFTSDPFHCGRGRSSVPAANGSRCFMRVTIHRRVVPGKKEDNVRNGITLCVSPCNVPGTRDCVP